MRLKVTACHKGAQDATAHVGLHLGNGALIKASRCVRLDPLGHWASVTLRLCRPTRYGLKHPIEHAHMKVHMRVQAGAKTVDEGHCAQVQAGRITLRRSRAMRLQALHHNAQEDAQRSVECGLVALQVLAQPLGHGQHPLAHRQAREDGMRSGNHTLAPPMAA